MSEADVRRRKSAKINQWVLFGIKFRWGNLGGSTQFEELTPIEVSLTSQEI